jgi:hypothetical protein
VSALLSRARRARGCVTPGDDRLETRAYAVKRYLFRLGHAARSARFATSIEQLVLGLAPVMGWGTVPSARVERARFVRAHRKSVQRWVDDLQEAGVVAHEPERDEHGRWWRTQIALLAGPAPSVDELRVARARARGWRMRERARRRRHRRACALATIRSRASVPQRHTRRRLARARARTAHEARRREAIEAQIRAARARAEGRGLLTHPFGAPPTSADVPEPSTSSEGAQTPRSWVPAAARSEPTLEKTRSFVAGTGAHSRAAGARPSARALADRKECFEEIGRMPPGEFDALVARRVAERERQLADRAALRREHVLRRSQEVIDWPEGRICPFGRLTEAWVAHRYGPAGAAETGAAAAGPRSPALAGRAARAIALYEAFSDHRPPGWPETGPAALCALGGQRRAAVLAGDVARLLGLAKGMRAGALLGDARRRVRAAGRARRRQRAWDGRLLFRTGASRWESGEQRRTRVRDELLLAGADPAAWPNAALATQALELGTRRTAAPELIGPDTHPELDGVGARAQRYRAELTAGRWALSAGRDPTTQPHPQEDASR